MMEEMVTGDEEVKKLRHLGDTSSIHTDRSSRGISGLYGDRPCSLARLDCSGNLYLKLASMMLLVWLTLVLLAICFESARHISYI